jgi:RNA polymerase sigma-70 factor, ECF subfamily
MEQSRTYRAAESVKDDIPSDEALMAQVIEGDDDALATLIHRYEGPLFNYARKMLGNASDAEDVFQETFHRVHQHRRRFWRGSRFRPWLYRIATNLCKDRLRCRKRRPEVNASALERDGEWDGSDPVARRPSESMAPDEKAAANELADHMATALANLSVKHRAVFLMAPQDGMPYEEIAKTLRIPTGTVKSRMNKAVNQLMAALEAAR